MWALEIIHTTPMHNDEYGKCQNTYRTTSTHLNTVRHNNVYSERQTHNLDVNAHSCGIFVKPHNSGECYSRPIHRSYDVILHHRKRHDFPVCPKPTCSE